MNYKEKDKGARFILHEKNGFPEVSKRKIHLWKFLDQQPLCKMLKLAVVESPNFQQRYLSCLNVLHNYFDNPKVIFRFMYYLNFLIFQENCSFAYIFVKIVSLIKIKDWISGFVLNAYELDVIWN